MFEASISTASRWRFPRVFHQFDAIVRETVFVIAVDFISVCPSIVVGRTFQIDCVRVRCASLEVDEAHQLSREAKTPFLCFGVQTAKKGLEIVVLCFIVLQVVV